MWQSIISLIGGPVVKGLLDAYKAKLEAGTADTKVASDLASSEIAAQTQYKIAALGRWYEPDHLMGYCVAFYIGKLLVWDKALGLGTTDGLCKIGENCWTGSVANTIVAFYFGKKGFENIVGIIKGIRR